MPQSQRRMLIIVGSLVAFGLLCPGVAARVETFDPRAGRVVVDALLIREGDRYLINQEDAVPPSAIGTPPAGATDAVGMFGTTRVR
ncbi:MAG TPA: hypothetical protein VFI22_01130 [Thermomicrobiales bacterium]|nr:hypothetical protein [Thermomicrobiales bacterium]